MAEVRVFDEAGQVADAVCAAVVDAVRAKPGLVLGLATGATMVPVYARLVAAHRAGLVSFARCRSFNLDEYCGLPADHPGSFAATMRRLLFDHIDLPPGAAQLPQPGHEAAYERAIAEAGGIDLQLLGIGVNGHIGFNEPGASLDSRTRVVTLSSATRAANAASFPGEVPAQAVTMGIGTILAARALLLVATGPAKRLALHAALAGPIGPDCPASAIRRHARAAVLCDAAAAGHMV